MDIIRITRETLSHFKLIITEEALELLNSDSKNTFAFGAIIDGMPVGATVAHSQPPAARLVH